MLRRLTLFGEGKVMRKLSAAVVVGVITVLSLVGTSAASAATEFGSHCTANRAEEGETYATVQLSQGGIANGAPVSGVITSWKISLVPVPFVLPQQLKIFRPTGNPSQFQVVGESAVSSVVSGVNTFATRIPIQAGDRIGLFANSQFGALFCAETAETETPGNSIGFVLGTPTVGSTATLAGSVPDSLVPAAVVIEPDADGDGFGDETQDACPQSAAVQVACPVVSLKVTTTTKKKLVNVIVTSTSTARVTVKGKVSLGKGKTAKLTGGSKNAAPGAFTRFRLNFPASLIDRLEELTPKQSLTLKITASAPNVAHAATKKVVKVKLKGQAAGA